METKSIEKARGLAYVSTGILMITYLIYARDVFLGKIMTNPLSWTIWTIIALVNSWSYFALTKDKTKIMIYLGSMSMCLIIAVISAFKGESLSFSTTNIIVFIMAILALCVWQVSRHGMFAQYLIQTALWCGFIPLWVTIVHHDSEEPFWLWILWTVAYALNFVVAIKRLNNKWQDLIAPTNYLLLHIITSIFLMI